MAPSQHTEPKALASVNQLFGRKYRGLKLSHIVDVIMSDIESVGCLKFGQSLIRPVCGIAQGVTGIASSGVMCTYDH